MTTPACRIPARPSGHYEPVAGSAAVKRNRFIRLCGGIKTVDRVLAAKGRDLAGLKGYVSSLAACPDGIPVTAEFVIGASRRLFQIERSFRMSEHDLQARPVCRHGRDSVDAYFTIVPVALTLSRWAEAAAGRTIRKSARASTAAGLLPDGYGALDRTGQRSGVRSWRPSPSY